MEIERSSQQLTERTLLEELTPNPNLIHPGHLEV